MNYIDYWCSTYLVEHTFLFFMFNWFSWAYSLWSFCFTINLLNSFYVFYTCTTANINFLRCRIYRHDYLSLFYCILLLFFYQCGYIWLNIVLGWTYLIDLFTVLCWRISIINLLENVILGFSFKLGNLFLGFPLWEDLMILSFLVYSCITTAYTAVNTPVGYIRLFGCIWQLYWLYSYGCSEVQVYTDKRIFIRFSHIFFFSSSSNWLLRFLLLNSICLIPMNLYLSGNTILILSFWIPLRVQYLLGLINNIEFFRYVYGVFDIYIELIVRIILFILSLVYGLFLFILSKLGEEVPTGLYSDINCISSAGTNSSISFTKAINCKLNIFNIMNIPIDVLNWYVNLIILIIQLSLFIYFLYKLYQRLLIFSYVKSWCIHSLSWVFIFFLLYLSYLSLSFPWKKHSFICRLCGRIINKRLYCPNGHCCKQCCPCVYCKPPRGY